MWKHLPSEHRVLGRRHTCTTLMLCEGVHFKLAQDLLGHATIAITLDTYSHLLPGMDDEASGAMDRIFS